MGAMSEHICADNVLPADFEGVVLHAGNDLTPTLSMTLISILALTLVLDTDHDPDTDIDTDTDTDTHTHTGPCSW